MFLNNASKGLNDVSRNILTIGIVIAFFGFIGYFPLILSLLAKYADMEQLENTKYMSALLGTNTFFVLILFPFILGLISLIFSIKFIHKRTIKSLFTVRNFFDWKRFFFSFFIWGGVMLVFFLISFFSGDSIKWNINTSTFVMLVLISILILPLQTTFEEAFFRGFLFQATGSIFKRGWVSVVITGVLFGMMHVGNPEVDRIGMVLMVYYIMNGLFLGLIVLMDDGLELTMGYHAINNIFAAVLVTNDWQAFHTDALFMDTSPPQFGYQDILVLLIIQPLLILVFSKKYKWKNWKQRILQPSNEVES